MVVMARPVISAMVRKVGFSPGASGRTDPGGGAFPRRPRRGLT